MLELFSIILNILFYMGLAVISIIVITFFMLLYSITKDYNYKGINDKMYIDKYKKYKSNRDNIC